MTLTDSHGPASAGTPPQFEIVDRARQGREPRPATAHRRTGGGRRSEGNDVGCLHAVDCPLFPLLNASLQGWRDYYCDDQDRWRECARYKLSRTGERVPISLLPNGHRVLHLENAADSEGSGTANPRQAPWQASRSRTNPRSPETPSRPQPAPGLRPWASGPGAGAPEPTHQSEPPFPPGPARHHQPSPPTRTPQPPGNNPSDRRTRRSRRAHGSERGWWARLVDWMRGPA